MNGSAEGDTPLCSILTAKGVPGSAASRCKDPLHCKGPINESCSSLSSGLSESMELSYVTHLDTLPRRRMRNDAMHTLLVDIRRLDIVIRIHDDRQGKRACTSHRTRRHSNVTVTFWVQ